VEWHWAGLHRERGTFLAHNVDAFMYELWRQGGLAGTKQEHAYFVKCDSLTMTPDDVVNGIVNIEVGFAPLKPAEFVILQISQKIA